MKRDSVTEDAFHALEAVIEEELHVQLLAMKRPATAEEDLKAVAQLVADRILDDFELSRRTTSNPRYR